MAVRQPDALSNAGLRRNDKSILNQIDAHSAASQGKQLQSKMFATDILCK